jgi:hypothetical protein
MTTMEMVGDKTRAVYVGNDDGSVDAEDAESGETMGVSQRQRYCHLLVRDEWDGLHGSLDDNLYAMPWKRTWTSGYVVGFVASTHIAARRAA